MGTLRSASDCSGLTVNGVTLGSPTFTDDVPTFDADLILFAWDDSRLPNGFIENDGTITIDELEGI